MKRRFHVWKVLTVLCFSLCVLVMITRVPTDVGCPDPSDPYLQMRDVQDNRLFDVKRDALQSLDIPYKQLLGSPSGTK
ncbi:hypothetical protein GDO81_019538, partial [Engystomops pustulosus]